MTSLLSELDRNYGGILHRNERDGSINPSTPLFQEFHLNDTCRRCLAVVRTIYGNLLLSIQAFSNIRIVLTVSKSPMNLIRLNITRKALVTQNSLYLSSWSRLCSNGGRVLLVGTLRYTITHTKHRCFWGQ